MNRRGFLGTISGVAAALGFGMPVFAKSMAHKTLLELPESKMPARSVQDFLDSPGCVVPALKKEIFQHEFPFEHWYYEPQLPNTENYCVISSRRGDLIFVPMLELDHSIDWHHKYSRENRWDIVARALMVAGNDIRAQINKHQRDLLAAVRDDQKHTKTIAVQAGVWIPTSHDLTVTAIKADKRQRGELRDKLRFRMRYGLVVDTNAEKWPTGTCRPNGSIALEQPILQYGHESRPL